MCILTLSQSLVWQPENDGKPPREKETLARDGANCLGWRFARMGLLPHTHVHTLLVALVNERRFFVWCAIPAWHGNVLQPDNLELWRLESAPFGEFVAFVLVVNIRILATLNSPKMIYRGGPLEIYLDLLYKLHVASEHHPFLERLRSSSPSFSISTFYLAPQTALFNEV